MFENNLILFPIFRSSGPPRRTDNNLCFIPISCSSGIPAGNNLKNSDAVCFSIVPYSFAVCLPFVSRLFHTHLPFNFRLTFGYHIPSCRLIYTITFLTLSFSLKICVNSCLNLLLYVLHS